MPILLLIIWFLLIGRVDAETVIFGILLSALISLAAWRWMDYKPAKDLELLRNLPVLAVFTLQLIREIIKAALAVLAVSFSRYRTPDPTLVEFHSGLTNPTANVLLANAITLTPGTFTLFQEGDRFVVHCLRREYADGIADSCFVRTLSRLK